MPVQTRGNGWRARRKKGRKTYTGPIRETEAAANEDAQRLDEAAEVSIERLQEVHARLTRVLPVASVAQHGSGWCVCVCVTVGKERVRGPTRQSKVAAQEDLGRLQDSDAAELQSAVARLHQEVADTGAPCDREARFREVVLAETRNCLELEQDTDHGLALESTRLLVASYQEIEALSESTAGKLLLETDDLFDPLSRLTRAHWAQLVSTHLWPAQD